MKLVVVRIVFAVGILGLGAGSLKVLSSMKKPPARKEGESPPLPVRVVEVNAREASVTLVGLGTARVGDVLSVIPEVGGRVVEVSPRLETGHRIPRGTVLFRIDREGFELASKRAATDLERQKIALERLKRSKKQDEERLVLAEKSEALAKRNFERARDLLEKHDVGNQTAVEGAEASWVIRQEQRKALENGVALYPDRIRETEKLIALAEIAVESAALNLKKTEVTAPFAGRVVRVAVEKEAVVAPGREAVRLADDRRLEIVAPLDGADVARWFPFSGGGSSGGEEEMWWFAKPDGEVEVRVRWVEMARAGYWAGRIDRIERYDPQTRTVSVVVAVDSPGAWRGDEAGASPPYRLVEGMFCRVEIPGRTLGVVLVAPSASVDQDGTVFAAREGRLQRVRVDEVVRREEGWTFVRGGLKAGDLVLTSKAHHLVAGTKVKPVLPDAPVKEGAR
ncbi:MAG: efflux RND transporter periplasmic adaptor subunit [Planctomycetota bacterium]